MTSHTTTIRYIGQPEGYRSDIPLDIISNCELTPESDVGIYYEDDISGIGLIFRPDTDNARSVRALNFDGASRTNAIITLPKQFVKMFGLGDAPVIFFPGRGGLVAKINYAPRLNPDPPTENDPESTIADYSSGHYGVRVPQEIVDPPDPDTPDLLETVGENIHIWLDLTQDGSLAIIADLEEQRAPNSVQTVSANPSMLYRRDGELGFLFPIPVGDILLGGEKPVKWQRDGTRLIATLSE